jgi:hypothetical protein
MIFTVNINRKLAGMFVRIIVTLIIAGIIIGGYFFIADKIEAARQEKYKRYGSVIAETSLAAELYRNQKDSFFIARDLILKKYDLTVEEMKNLADELKLDPEEMVAFWKIATDLTDTVVARADSIRIIKMKEAADSGVSTDTMPIPPERRRDSVPISPDKK